MLWSCILSKTSESEALKTINPQFIEHWHHRRWRLIKIIRPRLFYPSYSFILTVLLSEFVLKLITRVQGSGASFRAYHSDLIGAGVAVQALWDILISLIVFLVFRKRYVR